MNTPLTAADLDRHEAERLHVCPRDANQGRGECPEHPRPDVVELPNFGNPWTLIVGGLCIVVTILLCIYAPEVFQR